MSSLFSDAISLMIAGMGFVFVFLTLLVFATTAMSAIINKYFPELPPVVLPPSSATPAIQSTLAGEDNNISAVIAIAVAKYRAGRKK
jgi:oxaloacetate decarboxylase gamma subunit